MSGSQFWDARGRGAEYRGHASPCEYKQPCTPDDSDPGCDGCGYAEPEQDAPLARDDARDVVTVCETCEGTGMCIDYGGDAPDSGLPMDCPDCSEVEPAKCQPALSVRITVPPTVVKQGKASVTIAREPST